MTRKSGKTKKQSLSSRAGMNVAQSLFSRKETLFNKSVKTVVGIGVSVFQKASAHMKDDIIEEDIGFTAEELNNYQYGSSDEE